MDMYIPDNNSTRHCNNPAQFIPDEIHNNICITHLSGMKQLCA